MYRAAVLPFWGADLEITDRAPEDYLK
jgi:hypothetical protein